MAAEQVVAKDSFVRASSFTVWYKELYRDGSCLRVYDLLAEKRELIHELGFEGITALHKGVQHGCVKLVRFILVDMFDGDGKCTCRRCGADNQTCVLTREGLLRKTSAYGSTAVNMAVVSGSPKMVLLLKWAIDMSKSLCTEMGLTEEDHPSWEDEHPDFFNLWEFNHSIDLNLGEKGKEEETEITNAAVIHLEVPDVKDDAIGENIYDADWSTKISEVYELIEEKLNKNWGDDQELMTLLKNMCEENVDFGFVPVAHIFLHFLFSIKPIPFDDSFERFRKEVFEDILVACKERDEKEGNSETSILVTLFKILDPRGRTILHVVLETGESTDVIFEILRGIEETWKHPLASTRMRECVNAKDGAGRSILHLACIHNINRAIFNKEWMKDKLDWDGAVSPLLCEELDALKLWCFPNYHSAVGKDVDCKPIHLAIVFNSANVLEFMPAFEGVDSCLNAPYAPGDYGYRIYLPFQIAAFLGRVPFVDHFLKSHTKSKCIEDGGLDTNYHKQCLPAIHCAALSGQVETIQTIVKYRIYDPLCQHEDEGTALHFLLDMTYLKRELERFKVLALLHTLPNDLSYVHLKHAFDCELNVPQEWPRTFSEDEVSCINLLLQAGIDLWTPSVGHHTKEHPTVGLRANNQARKWWYDKVVKEVVTQKTSITSAANSTSVVAALVATASIIGPLQPPLSYIGDGGYMDTTRSPVRVYLVCNSLSFFFSIASILMALLPAIPMPKESMYDELLRSQRCLKVAALMLLLAIICTLISFSSASIAVVTPEWSDKQLVVVCVVVGGGVCLVVLAIYVVRLLRMVFHKNDRFRRRFAKYMYF